MSLQPLPSVIIEPMVRAALTEDLGLAGDITTDAIDFANAQVALDLVARRAGLVAGLDFVAVACRLIEPLSPFPFGYRTATRSGRTRSSRPWRGLREAF